MRKYREEKTTRQIVTHVICDKCKKEFDFNKDFENVNLFTKIEAIGGYGSLFGDGDRYEADFCDKCWFELIGPYIRPHEYVYD